LGWFRPQDGRVLVAPGVFRRHTISITKRAFPEASRKDYVAVDSRNQGVQVT
jgi:hypothetical protein